VFLYAVDSSSLRSSDMFSNAVVTAIEVYGVGWFVAFMFQAIEFYRRNAAGELMAGFEKEASKDPEMLQHYAENHHGIRTKIKIFLPLGILAIAFAISSLWPLIVVIRAGAFVHGLLHRHDDHE